MSILVSGLPRPLPSCRQAIRAAHPIEETDHFSPHGSSFRGAKRMLASRDVPAVFQEAESQPVQQDEALFILKAVSSCQGWSEMPGCAELFCLPLSFARLTSQGWTPEEEVPKHPKHCEKPWSS